MHACIKYGPNHANVMPASYRATARTRLQSLSDVIEMQLGARPAKVLQLATALHCFGERHPPRWG